MVNSDKTYIVTRPKSRRWVKNFITAGNNFLCYLKEDEPECVQANRELIELVEEFLVELEKRFVIEY